MSNWKQDSLTKHVSLVTKGTTPTSIGKQFQDNGINFIKAESITDAGMFISSAFAYIDESTHEILKRSQLQNGDILFSIAGVLGRVAVVNRDILPANTNQAIAIIRLSSNSEIEKDFLKHLLNSEFVKEQIRRINVQAAQANFSLADINRLQIQYPKEPNEQSNIARILSTADAVIEKTQAAIAKYKAIKQGMLQDLFTRGIDLNTNKLRPRYEDAPELYKESKLGMIPIEWNEKIFGEEVDLIHGHQFRDYDFTEFGIPVVKIGQVKPENVDLSSCSFVAYGREDEFQNEIIRNGDVLMALTGATLGKACLVKGLNGVVLQNYRVGRFEPIIKENDIDKEFLYYLLIAGDLLTQIFNKVNTGAQGNIGKADFEKASFKKPPFDEQQIIAERLKAIDNKLQTELTYLQKMQSLKKGLMEDLLSGRKQVKINEATTV